MAPPRLAALTKLTLETAPSRLPRLRLVAVAREPPRGRQGRAGWSASRSSSARSGPSTTTATAACSARCSTGRRRSSRAPRSCPAGPPSDDAMLVTCAYLVDESSPWVLAVALPRRDRRGARPRRDGDRGVRLPLPGGRVGRTSASSSTARSSRATSSTTSASASCARRAASGSPARARRPRRRSRKAAREGAAGRAGGVHCRSRSRCRGPRAAPGAARDGVEQQLGDLDRVQRRALAEVVAREVEREAVLGGRVAADAADEHLVHRRRPCRGDGNSLERAPTARAARSSRASLGGERLARARPRRPRRARPSPARGRRSPGSAGRAAPGSCASRRGASTPRPTRRRPSPSPCEVVLGRGLVREARPSPARRRRRPTGRSRRARARARPPRGAASGRR